MEVKKFYRTQREVALAINVIIDEYWKNNLTDEQLEDNIQIIYKNNKDKVIKNYQYTTIIKQQCGKKRLSVVSKIIGKDKN